MVVSFPLSTAQQSKYVEATIISCAFTSLCSTWSTRATGVFFCLPLSESNLRERMVNYMMQRCWTIRQKYIMTAACGFDMLRKLWIGNSSRHKLKIAHALKRNSSMYHLFDSKVGTRRNNCSTHVLWREHQTILWYTMIQLSLIHIWRCRRIERCRSRWSPYH